MEVPSSGVIRCEGRASIPPAMRHSNHTAGDADCRSWLPASLRDPRRVWLHPRSRRAAHAAPDAGRSRRTPISRSRSPPTRSSAILSRRARDVANNANTVAGPGHHQADQRRHRRTGRSGSSSTEPPRPLRKALAWKTGGRPAATSRPMRSPASTSWSSAARSRLPRRRAGRQPSAGRPRGPVAVLDPLLWPLAQRSRRDPGPNPRAKAAPPSVGQARQDPPAEQGAMTAASPARAAVRRGGLGPRQADHRAPPAGRPPAVHPDRGGSRRVRGGRPGPHEPPRRARDPPGRRRHRSAEARVPADGNDRDPLRGRPADGRWRRSAPRCPRSTTSSSPPARTTS